MKTWNFPLRNKLIYLLLLDFTVGLRLNSSHQAVFFWSPPGARAARLYSEGWTPSNPTFRLLIARSSTSAPAALWPSSLPPAPRATSAPSTQCWLEDRPSTWMQTRNTSIATSYCRCLKYKSTVLFLQNDLQVCDVWYGFYPEALAVHALWHSFSQAKSARVQVSWLHQALRPERIDDGAYQGQFSMQRPKILDFELNQPLFLYVSPIHCFQTVNAVSTKAHSKSLYRPYQGPLSVTLS